MTLALLVLKTGDLYRFVNPPPIHAKPKTGDWVECYNALLKKRRTRKDYDRVLTVQWDDRLYKVCQASEDALEAKEVQRAKERVCRRYHPDKCEPTFLLISSRQEKSINEDPEWLRKEILRVVGLCLQYFQEPGKFDRTKVSSLTFDLRNVLGCVEREGKRREDNGNPCEAAGSAPGISSRGNDAVHPEGGQKEDLPEQSPRP